MGAGNTKSHQNSFTAQSGKVENTQQFDFNSEARVDSITVEGLKRTKNDLIENAVRDLFSAKTFSSLMEKVSYVTERLHHLDCFLNINVYIDVNHSEFASKNGYRVIYKVEEKGYARAQTNLSFGDNEGVFMLKGKLLNLKGHAEKVETTYSYSTGRTSDMNVTFVKPLLTSLPALSSASVFHHGTEELTSGYRLKQTGVLLNFEVQPIAKMTHNIQYEAAMRSLSLLSKNVAFEVREYSGHTLKSSLRHILSYDLRDSAVFPRNGVLLGTKTEFAGLGGNISFLKNESFFQLNVPLTTKLTGQFTLQAGLMKQIDDNKMISVCDNLFLGGPLSVRGFTSRGIGTQTDGYALGVHSYWASGLHIYSNIPFLSENSAVHKVCRSHAFLNFGACGPFTLTQNFYHNIDELTRNLRVSCGAGVSFHLGPSQIELNCCIPLRYNQSDSIFKGLQISVGTTFL